MKKNAPTPTRAAARRRSAALGEQLRDWLQAQNALAAIARRKARKAAAESTKGKRGVDRVPARYRATRPEPTWVHQHTSPSRALTRPGGYSRGRLNEPYTNPLRDVKALRSGRLRAELRP